MEIKELKPADVLLFEGERDSLISRAIMLLTGSPVSHAALFFREPQEIVEETPPAVAVHDAAERFRGREIYVNRLESGPTDFRPVLEAAQGYLNDEEPYAMSNLYLVGFLLIYKRFTPDTGAKKIMIKILKKVTAEVLEFIHRHKTPGKEPMVCSQFVYQCFEDAGKTYDLGLHGALLKTHLMSAGVPAEESTLDRVVRHVDAAGEPAVEARLLSAPAQSVPAESEEELLTELITALQPQPAALGGAAIAEAETGDDLVDAVAGFARAVQATRPEAETRTTRAGFAQVALLSLKSDQAAFVTPADLLNRCRNLTRVGTIDI